MSKKIYKVVAWMLSIVTVISGVFAYYVTHKQDDYMIDKIVESIDETIEVERIENKHLSAQEVLTEYTKAIVFRMQDGVDRFPSYISPQKVIVDKYDNLIVVYSKQDVFEEDYFELQNDPNTYFAEEMKLGDIELSGDIGTTSVSVYGNGHMSYAPEMMNADAFVNKVKGSNKQITVGVIDTGLYSKNSVIHKYVDESYDFYNNDISVYDGIDAHATTVISAMKDILSDKILDTNVKLIVGKVLQNGTGDSYTLFSAIMAMAEKCDIINLSLGGKTNNKLIKYAVDYAENKGCVIVCAAGNSGKAVEYPAAYNNTIAVSAIDKNKKLASFSSRGDEVDFCAGGVDVIVDSVENTQVMTNGTSYSSPYITGMAVLAMLDNESIIGSKDKVVEYLAYYTEDLGKQGKDASFGYGVPVYRVEQEETTSIPKNEKESLDVPTTEKTIDNRPEEEETTKPIEKEPTTKKPVVEEPTTEKPTTKEPATEAPTTKEPVTEKPTIKEPTTKAPAKEEETTKAPTIKVQKVSLNKTEIALKKEDNASLTATVSPSNATNKAITWTSSNSSVAKVDSYGNVTAVGNGTATITVKSKDGNKVATCKITVTTSPTGVSITNKQTLALDVNKTFQCDVSVSPSSASNKSVKWSSSDSSIAKVDSNGKITALKCGVATITVKTVDGSKTDFMKVYVYQTGAIIDQKSNVWYKICIASATNRIIDVANGQNYNGAKVQLCYVTLADAQLWQFHNYTTTHGGIAITPKSNAGSFILDANRGTSYSSPLKENNLIDLWTLGQDNAASMWQIVKLWDGSYIFKLINTNLVAGVTSTEPGTQLKLKNFDVFDMNQRWFLEAVTVDKETTSPGIETAISWAQKQKNNNNMSYCYWCLKFLGDAFRQGGIDNAGYSTATEAGNALITSTNTNPPRGAVVFWDWYGTVSGIYKNWGHAGISLGNGQVIHADYNGVKITGLELGGRTYRGWGVWK